MFWVSRIIKEDKEDAVKFTQEVFTLAQDKHIIVLKKIKWINWHMPYRWVQISTPLKQEAKRHDIVFF